MGTITRKWVWVFLLIPPFNYTTDSSLPKRIKLRTSDELHQAISETAHALKALKSINITITFDITPPLLGLCCLALITTIALWHH